MALADDLRMYGMQQGCPVHGDDQMIDCTMCGYEFCRTCFRNSLVCPDCAEEAKNDSDEDNDYDELRNIDRLLGEDIDDLVDEDELDEIPAEDLVDDEPAEEREEEVTPYEGEPPD